MENQLISYETSLFAKKKGFNEQCKAFIEPKYHDVHEFIDDPFLYVYPGYTPMEKHNEILKEGWLLAPTQSLLQRWLREIHGLHIQIAVDQTSYPKFQFIIVQYKPDYNWNTVMLSDLHRTYEEALEEGLFEALKLIKDE
jgi:hypothetical protein